MVEKKSYICNIFQDYCNDKQPFPLNPKRSVRCHLAMGDVTDEDISIRMNESREHLQYCFGEFCIIQQTHVENYGEYFIKGCLRVSKTAMLVVSFCVTSISFSESSFGTMISGKMEFNNFLCLIKFSKNWSILVFQPQIC